MKLDYGIKNNNVSQEPITEQQEYNPTYKSSRDSDKYRDFISMQQVVNTALAKDREDDNPGANRPGEANISSRETVSGWEKV